MRPRAILLVLLLSALLLAVSVQASAHPRAVPAVASDSVVDTTPSTTTRLTPPAETIEAGLAPGPTGWFLVLLLVAVGAGWRVARPRAVALGLIALVLFLGFETSVHSVHHLGESGGVQCTVATAAGHMDGTVSIDPVTVSRADRVVDQVLVGTHLVLDRRGARLEQPRAPPA
jgi:hypothetical protein